MAQFIEPVLKLINRFSRLPGIGPKTAQRLAFYILKMPEEEVDGFSRDLSQARKGIGYCEICGNLIDETGCAICRDPKRDKSTVCVVSDVKDLLALERTMEYTGLYHVLNGTISPMEGIGPDDIRIRELLARLTDGEIQEVILSTNPDVTGEATAAYIARLIKPMGLKVTRIAHGVPVGGDLEYTDEVTLTKALEGRRDY
jgi:recombination protein RecR